MSTTTESQTGRERSTIYVVTAVVVGALMVAGLIFFSSAKATKEAEQKADQFSAALKEAGAATVPSTDQIVRVLGDDGGATCQSPNESLSRSVLLAQLANGAGGPGTRPVIADSRALQGQLLIIEVYCPEELEEFRQFVEDLKTDNVVGD